jgi:hypothetical protein
MNKEADMKNTKQKSSGWQPVEKRGPWRERWDRSAHRQAAKARRDCDGAHVWKACPSARCQRMHGCAGQNPFQCLQNHRLKEQQAQLAQRQLRLAAELSQTSAPRAGNGFNTALPPMSAKEAAALIAASIAAEPPEPL